MKLFVYNLRDYDEKVYYDQFCAQYGYEYTATADYPSLDNAGLAAGCQALSIIVCEMTPAMLERFAALGIRYIITRSIGAEHLDAAKANALGMRISNVSYTPDAVANFTVALMLMACRRIPYILQRTALQDYSLPGKMGRELSRCTVGVIGAGRIGAAVLRRLSGFGCRLLAYDPFPNPAAAPAAQFVSLPELYAQSDLISLHIPAAPQNHHLIDAAALRQMRPGAILVNTARGDLIDTAALIDALESGHLCGAALDVLENEHGLCYLNRSGETLPNRELALLRAMPNVILTPHVAFYTDEVISNMIESTLQSLHAFENGQPNPLEIKAG